MGTNGRQWRQVRTETQTAQQGESHDKQIRWLLIICSFYGIHFFDAYLDKTLASSESF